MWLITTCGFFSIVRKPEDVGKGTLTIRSRVRSDLEALANVTPGMSTISEKGGTDYPFRASAPKEAVAKAFADMLTNVEYVNFKNEVAKEQGKDRAHAYGEVWSVLHGLTKSAASKPAPTGTQFKSSAKPRAYGGVVLDAQGRVLLRRPKGHFDGYVWTFPKGKSDPGEAPEQTALREVLEETGYSVEIRVKIPGAFSSGQSVTEFFLMEVGEQVGQFDEAETSEIKWATFAEAGKLIAMTTNQAGRERDLAVLDAAKAIV